MPISNGRLPQALQICQRLREINPFWIEEPTHPDDVRGHKTLVDAIAPTKTGAWRTRTQSSCVLKIIYRRNAPASSK